MMTIVYEIYRYKSFIALLLIALCSNNQIKAQDVVLQEEVMGKAVVTSPTSVIMNPGFHAVEGSAFRAYIDQNANPIVSPKHEVPSLTNNTIPAAGTPNQNYIKTITYREPRTNDPDPNTPFQHLEEINYFDGLGRPIQTVSVGASPSGEEDIIQPILYDNFGREKYKPLPFTASKTGNFRANVSEITVSDYYKTIPLEEGIEVNPTEERAYTETGFDNSPLNRVVSQTGPGQAWANKLVQINYLTNNAADGVLSWSVDDDENFSSEPYPENSLFVTETIDEDGHATREYKDKQGKVVQKSTYDGSKWLRTTYIYDDLDLLRCVMPPKASDPNTETGLCYYYNYDHRNRMIEKIIPGGGTVKMIYDLRDRLRCSQNSEQDNNNEWSYIQYDELNRPVITGIIKNYDRTREIVETELNNITVLNESLDNNMNYYAYNHASFPTISNIEVQTVTYYDDYRFLTHLGADSVELKSSTYNSDLTVYGRAYDATPKGQVTGTLTRVLNPGDSYEVADPLLYTADYYDKYGHLLRTISENHLNGKDIVSNQYQDITWLVTRSKQQHFKDGIETIIEKTFTYDHTGRLLETIAQVNAQTQFTLNAIGYNKQGQLLAKYLHSDQTTGERTFTQQVDYRYNIRGWLTKINDPSLTSDNDLFGMQLSYNTPADLGTLGNSAQACFNGNISGMKWGIKNELPSVRGYTFTYDGLNRLKTNNYAEGSSLNENTGYYTESVTLYDDNGNIKNLERRYNNSLVDNLTYNYENAEVSNRISAIIEAATPGNAEGVDDYPGNSGTYSYDDNGNMTHDGSRDADLAYYNTINLPKSADFGNNNRILYHYTAGGAKLVKHVIVNGSIHSYDHYIGNIVYEGDRISYITTEEGRMVNKGTGNDYEFVYEYNLKDHLSNNRVTFLGKTIAGGVIEVMQTSHYYPFGLTLSQNNYNPATGYSGNKYLYNGKEIQDERFGDTFFGMLDYGARFYDPQIGRFHTQDAFAEKYLDVSPYQYALNNPIKYIDVNGDSVNLAELYSKNQLGIYNHSAEIYVFELFAGTKEGRKYILDHAQKGFSLQGAFVKNLNINADKAGVLNDKGIDINVKAGVVEGGVAHTADNSDGGNSHPNRLKLDFTIGYVSTETRSDWSFRDNILYSVDGVSHEFGLHGNLLEQRYLGINSTVKAYSHLAKSYSVSQYLRNWNGTNSSVLPSTMAIRILDAVQNMPIKLNQLEPKYSAVELYNRYVNPGLATWEKP